MNEQITARITALREQMEQEQIMVYIVPTADFHASEYIGDYFKTREYLTGFTGSAGTAVFTADAAGLWTDGRYFIQAERELSGTPVKLYRLGVQGEKTVDEFLKEHLTEGGCIGFDGRMVTAKDGEHYRKIAEEKHAKIRSDADLCDRIWTDRPAMSKEPFFVLEDCYSGRSTADKLADVRAEMVKCGAQAHILSSLCDIAWLLNVRGNDISYVPVVLSFLLLTETDCIWYVQEEIITEEQRGYLEENHIRTKPYESIYRDAAALPEHGKVLLDRSSVSTLLVDTLPQSAKVVDEPNPTERLKAVKNPVELANTLQAHIRDGVAVTKFLCWLKTHVASGEITELSAEEKLESFRREQEYYLEPSFRTISAYGANAAMMHYAASEESNARLKPEGFLLVDSGGHYLEGTTDITRTVALGELTQEMKENFTAVCRANLNLAAAKFIEGCRGFQLDILAREPLWERGLDYRCGTGHGVGHILNVHEGPNAFRYHCRKETFDREILYPGMITTDEPGVYVENGYGIRTENELVCRICEENEYGRFLEFQTITFVPVDLDAILPEEMSAVERERLNDYHRMVYETVSSYLTKPERNWLKEYTRAI